MADNRATAYKELRELIEDSNKREDECREYLQYAAAALVPNTARDFVYVQKERRGTSGDSDYAISCKVCDEAGVESVKAYIWELKAPQCFIFEKDTENRLKPSSDLTQAENQLLHYYHELKGSEQFKNEFGITHSDNVVFGGIIIGCRKKRISGRYDEESKKDKLYEKALMIRRKYIYDPNQIKIFTWDYILDFIKPPVQLAGQPAKVGQLQTQSIDPRYVTFTTSG